MSAAHVTASVWTTTACSWPASLECNSLGWTPRWATGWSRRGTESPSRFKHSGTTRSGRWKTWRGALGTTSPARTTSNWLIARANSFCEQFWNESTGCLYDVVNGDSRDEAIRPNQIFAVSLFHSMLSREKAKSVLAAAERHLLTPYGLRSLAPSDPQYRGRYEGNPWSRDSAYHQGTVWPWLMGPFRHCIHQGQWAIC